MYDKSRDVDAVIVQRGWHVFSRDGEELGEVVSADQNDLVIDHDGERWQFATDLLKSQEESEMRASLDVSVEQAQRMARRTES